jgi:hypothetical protein
VASIHRADDTLIFHHAKQWRVGRSIRYVCGNPCEKSPFGRKIARQRCSPTHPVALNLRPRRARSCGRCGGLLLWVSLHGEAARQQRRRENHDGKSFYHDGLIPNRNRVATSCGRRHRQSLPTYRQPSLRLTLKTAFISGLRHDRLLINTLCLGRAQRYRTKKCSVIGGTNNVKSWGREGFVNRNVRRLGTSHWEVQFNGGVGGGKYRTGGTS